MGFSKIRRIILKINKNSKNPNNSQHHPKVHQRRAPNAGANIQTSAAARGMATRKDAAQLGDAPRSKQGPPTNIPAVSERAHRVPQAELFVQCPGTARAHQQWGPAGIRCHRVAVS